MVDQFQFKKIWPLIVLCFVATALLANKSSLGMPYWIILFAPIYEEVIFRGWILGNLKKRFSVKWAIGISSVVFGLWHLKNLFYFDAPDVVYQMVYAGLLLGPVFGYIAVKTKTIWPGVILHYLNSIGSLALMMGSLDWRSLF